MLSVKLITMPKWCQYSCYISAVQCPFYLKLTQAKRGTGKEKVKHLHGGVAQPVGPLASTQTLMSVINHVAGAQ